jgi:hypothetical protein
MARALAAAAAAALIAGCGGSGGSPTPPATSPATPTPVVSGSGAGVQDQAGAGSSGTGSAAAGKLSTAATGSISHASTGSYSKAPSSQVNQGSQGSAVMTPAQAKAAENLANKLNNLINQSATNTPPPSTTTTKQSTTPPPTQTSTPPKTKVVVVIRTKIHTVYLNRTTTKSVPKTVTKTVTKTVAPKVPTGAFLPSKHPELGQQSFTITGSNLGCMISQTGVHCGIKNRSWTPPVQPSSCKSTWGDTIALASKGLPKFACGGNSPIQAGAKVVPSGWDDKVGNYTCQVRSFDVNCFNSTSNSGFMISRTGYSVY